MYILYIHMCVIHVYIYIYICMYIPRGVGQD